MENKIKIISKKPALWFIIKLFFPLYDYEKGTVFTFSNRIYGKNISVSTLMHEKVHCRQMGYSMARGVLHFIRYYLSKNYRFKMELEAFREQYKFNKDNLKYLAKELSGPLYGNLCSFYDAIGLIMDCRKR